MENNNKNNKNKNKIEENTPKNKEQQEKTATDNQWGKQLLNIKLKKRENS